MVWILLPMILRRLLLHLLSILLLISSWLPGTSMAQSLDEPAPQISSITYETTAQTPDYFSCGDQVAPVGNWDYEQKVVELVNQERKLRDLPPLKRVDLLDQAARYHSADLGQDNYFDHDSYDRVAGELTFVCLWWARIQTYYTNVRAENIAGGYPTPASVVAAWMDSPGHRKNMLSAYSDEIGVGYYEGSGQYNTYWTQDFGDRSGVYPVVINGEAAQTDDRMVSLYIYGDWDEMRLRNNEGAWTSWQTFQNTLAWLLPPTNGEHIVSVEMRDSSASTASSDLIYLSAQPTDPELGNLPDNITFIYSISTGQYLPELAIQSPLNVGNYDALNWEISTEGTWFTVTPTLGTTPEVFQIIPGTIMTPSLITSTGVITVSANSLMGIECSPHVMNVAIHMIDSPFNRIYIPIIARFSP